MTTDIPLAANDQATEKARNIMTANKPEGEIKPVDHDAEGAEEQLQQPLGQQQQQQAKKLLTANDQATEEKARSNMAANETEGEIEP